VAGLNVLPRREELTSTGVKFETKKEGYRARRIYTELSVRVSGVCEKPERVKGGWGGGRGGLLFPRLVGNSGWEPNKARNAVTGRREGLGTKKFLARKETGGLVAV